MGHFGLYRCVVQVYCTGVLYRCVVQVCLYRCVVQVCALILVLFLAPFRATNVLDDIISRNGYLPELQAEKIDYLDLKRSSFSVPALHFSNSHQLLAAPHFSIDFSFHGFRIDGRFNHLEFLATQNYFLFHHLNIQQAAWNSSKSSASPP